MNKGKSISTDQPDHSGKTMKRVSKMKDKEADCLRDVAVQMSYQHEVAFQKTVEFFD